MLKTGLGVLRREDAESFVNGQLKSRERACFKGAETLFELRPAFLNGIEVRRVGRQIEQRGPGLLDEFFDPSDLVSSQIVHHYNLAGLELRAENFLQVSEKDIAIGRSFDDHGRDPAGNTDRTQNSQRAPMARRNSFVDAFAAQRAPVTPGHFRCHAAFVQEDEALRIDLFAFFPPELSVSGGSLAILFGGVERLF